MVYLVVGHFLYNQPMPKLSLVCATMNSEKYLPRMYKSIMRQKLPVELIFVCDPSNDKTFEVVSSFLPNCKAIFNKERLGVTKSRLEGVKIASGEYVGFVDADDWIEDDFSIKMMEVAKDSDADIIDASYYYARSTSDRIKAHPRPKSGLMDNMSAIKLLFGDYKLRGFIWNKVYKKSLFQGGRYISTKKFEDMPFLFSILLKAKNIYFFNEHLYNYFKGGDENSLTNSNLKDRALRHLECFLSIRYFADLSNSSKLVNLVRKAYFRSSLSLAYDLHLSKKAGLDKAEAKKIKLALKGMKAKGLLPLTGSFYEKEVKASIKEFDK